MKELELIDVLNTRAHRESYALVLQTKEDDDATCFSIQIGFSEARAIIWAQNNIAPLRPTSHDLFINLMEKTGWRLLQIRITHYHEGIFYTTLSLQNNNNDKVEIDARPSDAIVIALKKNVPIFIEEEVLTQYPCLQNPYDKGNEQNTEGAAQQPVGLLILENELKKAIETEDFERAEILNKQIQEARQKNMDHPLS